MGKFSKMTGIIAATMMSMNGEVYGRPEYMPTDEERKQRAAENLEKYYLKNGLQKFEIEGTVVWARDEKNANRKYKNGQK